MSGLKHEFECRLNVAPERAFAALSDASELKVWFAEHVEVEPKAGGEFRFWGKHTYGAPTRPQATQRLVRYEKPNALAYTWMLHEQPSQVSLAIEPDPAAAGSVVKGTHEFAVAPRMARAKEMVDDLWRLHMGNLYAYTAGGSGVLMPDYTDSSPEIRMSIVIDAPRERVFRALMEPELLNQWIASAAAVEPRVGGRYSFGWKSEHEGVVSDGGLSRILELVHDEKLVVDWPDWRGDKSVPTQKITWLLESVGQQTRVTMIHSGFVRAVDFSDYPHGWGFFLGRLERVSTGKPVDPGAACG